MSAATVPVFTIELAMQDVALCAYSLSLTECLVEQPLFASGWKTYREDIDPQRTVDPARMIAESLASDPGIREQNRHITDLGRVKRYGPVPSCIADIACG